MPRQKISLIFNWTNRSEKGERRSIPQYVELNGDRLKLKYIAFIYDIGQFVVNKKKIVEHLEISPGFSLWWMTLLAEKSPYKSPHIQDCIKLLALEEVLIKEAPNAILVDGVCNRQVVESILNLCASLDIEVTFSAQEGRTKKIRLEVKQCYRFLPHPLQGIILLTRNLFRYWALRRVSPPTWFSGDNALFFFSYFIHLDAAAGSEGRFYSRQWETLPKLLLDSGYQANWIHHFLFSHEVPDTSTGIEWVNKFNAKSSKQGKHCFLDSYLSFSVVVHAVIKWIRLIWVSVRLKKIKMAFCPKGSSVSLWPLLRNDWYASIRGRVSAQNILFIELLDKALGAMPRQKLGMYLYEGQGWERAFIYAWRRYNHGELIGVAHSTIRFWDLRYFDDLRAILSQEVLTMPQSNKIAVNGPAALNALLKASYPAGRLKEVEALRYLNLAVVPGNHGSKMDRSLSENRRLLVLGDIMPNTTRQMLETLQSLSKSVLSGFEIVVKGHPGNPIVKKDYLGFQFEITTGPLHKILHEFDLVYGANSTGASLDAYLCGLPVIVHIADGELISSPLRDVNDVHFVSNREDLEVSLNENLQMKSHSIDTFFWLDDDLPKWRRLIDTSVRDGTV